MKLTAAKFVVAFLLFPTLAIAESRTHPNQNFVCNTGYSQERCHKEMSELRVLLDRHHANWLGDWTWVLVRSEDWRLLMLRVGMNPDSPAFTVLQKRQTFFDEALFERQASRSAQLLNYWQMPLDELTSLAVAHEIGHAMCGDESEKRADLRARLLLEGKLPSCDVEMKRAAK